MNYSTAPRNNLAKQYADIVRVNRMCPFAGVAFPSYFAHLRLPLFYFAGETSPVFSGRALLSGRQFTSLVPFVAIV
jgi:hypothetical protein